jgi:GT2 family glycosyltransferase
MFEYEGSSGGWIDALGYPFSRGRVFDVLEKDHGQYNDVAPIFWASGAAMFVKADLYHELGGFDEFFFAHQEEIDFCWRMQRTGYLIYVCPQSVVYHVGGTLSTGNLLKVFLNFRIPHHDHPQHAFRAIDLEAALRIFRCYLSMENPAQYRYQLLESHLQSTLCLCCMVPG